MSARLLRINDWERLAIEAKFKPSTMAALCPISLRQMQRFFEKEFEKTPREWARELRCRIALRLIQEGWSNKAIAAELGFADECHFCHEFKRLHGFSPQSYVRVYGAAVPNGFSARHLAPAAAGASLDVAFRQECRVQTMCGDCSMTIKG